jgi:hypothetical protein
MSGVGPGFAVDVDVLLEHPHILVPRRQELPPPRLKLDLVLEIALYIADFIGVPKGIRTPVTAVTGRATT